jgi:hypothetical protein
MSERGESLDPVRMLNVASWRKLRASRGRVQRGLESQSLRSPNMRVQRTPSVLPPSPLSRQPLGPGHNFLKSTGSLLTMVLLTGCASSPRAASPEQHATVLIRSLGTFSALDHLRDSYRLTAPTGVVALRYRIEREWRDGHLARPVRVFFYVMRMTGLHTSVVIGETEAVEFPVAAGA